MNWKQVKNLLLLLLIAVNILLLVFVHTYYQKREFTDPGTARQAAALLDKSGISISPELLAVRNDSAPILNCTYNREEYLCYTAALLFGEEATGIYLLPNGIRAETRSGKTAELGFDFSISYTDPGIDRSYLHSALARATAPAQENAGATVKAALDILLALPEGTLADTPCRVADGLTFITVEQTEGGLPLYGMRCSFGFSDDRLVYAEGKYCFSIPKENSNEPLLNRTNILFSEKERGRIGSITDITLCYTLYEDAQNGSLLFIPAYALTYASGETYAVSAISGEAY